MPGVGIRRDDGFFGNGNHRVGADSNEQLPAAGDSMHSHRHVRKANRCHRTPKASTTADQRSVISQRGLQPCVALIN
jgi:hypothetical protein